MNYRVVNAKPRAINSQLVWEKKKKTNRRYILDTRPAADTSSAAVCRCSKDPDQTRMSSSGGGGKESKRLKYGGPLPEKVLAHRLGRIFRVTSLGVSHLNQASTLTKT